MFTAGHPVCALMAALRQTPASGAAARTVVNSSKPARTLYNRNSWRRRSHPLHAQVRTAAFISRTNQSTDLLQDFLGNNFWKRACKFSAPRFPIQILDLVRQYSTCNFETGRNYYFKRIAFDLICYRTQNDKPHFGIICCGRNNEGWPPS